MIAIIKSEALTVYTKTENVYRCGWLTIKVKNDSTKKLTEDDRQFLCELNSLLQKHSKARND